MNPMFYLATANKPTSVSHSCTLKDYFIVIKGCRLEVYSLDLCFIQGHDLLGKALTLLSLKDNQFYLLTDKLEACLLTVNGNQVKVDWTTLFVDRSCRRVDKQISLCNYTFYDNYTVIVNHVYQGMLHWILIHHQRSKIETFVTRLVELHVIQMSFPCSLKKSCQGNRLDSLDLLILFQDVREQRLLKRYQFVIGERDIVHPTTDQVVLLNDITTHLLIPCRNGVILIAERSIGFLKESTWTAITEEMEDQDFYLELNSQTMLTCYSPLLNSEETRFLVGDNNGLLHLLVAIVKDNQVERIQVERLGRISMPQTIRNVCDDLVFVGSHFGDSQLVKLLQDPMEDFEYLQEIARFPNLAPIVDFSLVDIDKRGQDQMVVCSGGYSDGSIRIIRNGIGVEELSRMPVDGLSGLWSLSNFDSDYDWLLIFSFFNETRIMLIPQLDGEEMQEVEPGNTIPPLITRETTIGCRKVAYNQLVQVTPSMVLLLSEQNQTSWSPEKRILQCSINDLQILVTTEGGWIHFLLIENGKLELKSSKFYETEIACCDISPFGNKSSSDWCALGMWQDMTLRILQLPSLQEHCQVVLSSDIMPRSVLFTTLEKDYCFAALGDGNLLSFEFNQGQLSKKRKISLGTQPINLHRFEGKQGQIVFAASDRPTIIHSSKERLLCSNLNLKQVKFVARFHSPVCPDALALVVDDSLVASNQHADSIIPSEDNLLICKMDAGFQQKLHIRTIPFLQENEMGFRICYQEESRLFGVVSTKLMPPNDKGKQVEEDGEEERSFVKIFDDQTFEVLDQYELKEREVVQCIMSFKDEQKAYIVVGTAFMIPSEDEPSQGRVLVFSVNEHRALNLVTEMSTDGAVYDVCTIEKNRLVIAINSKVQLVKWESNNLSVLSTYYGHVAAIRVLFHEGLVVVGDLMKSITVLQKIQLDNGLEALEEVAFDPQTNWITAIEVLPNKTFLAADSSGNLMYFNQEKTSDNNPYFEKKLKLQGAIHLGDIVNRFRVGSLVMQPTDPTEIVATPCMVFATVNGMIGTLSQLEPKYAVLLSKLQNVMLDLLDKEDLHVLPIHNKTEWRRFENDRRIRPMQGFIDGDFIEKFLLVDEELQQRVVKIVLEVDQVKDEVGVLMRVIEECSRLH